MTWGRDHRVLFPEQPIHYQSCFISYSSQDEEFARRLHEKMRGEKLRVWFAPEDRQGGSM